MRKISDINTQKCLPVTCILEDVLLVLVHGRGRGRRQDRAPLPNRRPAKIRNLLWKIRKVTLNCATEVQ